MENTRTQNIKRNVIFNIIKYVAQLLLQFGVRTVLIYVMGKEYLGLNGLYSSVFQFLNLAELGIGSAIVFSMYKPIAENDIEKIKSLQTLYKRFYLILSLIILVVGSILTPFIDIFINGEVAVNINIYLLFVMYLANTILEYLSAHKRSLLLAYQRNDVENKVKIVCLVLMSIIQIAVVIIFKNYYIYYAVTIFFTIIDCIWVHRLANKLFPEINGKSQPLPEEDKKIIVKNVAALSLHKIGNVIISSTDNILISSFFGLAILGIYSNYLLILNGLINIFNFLNNALAGSVGNLISSKDEDYVYKKFKQINFIYSFLTSFCTICLFILVQPFIAKWTKSSEYLLNISLVFLICISFYLTRKRHAVNLFKDCAGLFWNDRWKPIVEAVVNLGVSILLAKLIGINGIILGTIISTLIAPFWIEPCVLYKSYFKKKTKGYFLRYLLDFVVMLAVGSICFFICSFIPDGTILMLILKFAVCIILSLGLLVVVYMWTPEFKECLSIAKSVLKPNDKAKKTK